MNLLDLPGIIEQILNVALDDDDNERGGYAKETIRSVFNSDENPLDPAVPWLTTAFALSLREGEKRKVSLRGLGGRRCDHRGAGASPLAGT